MWHYNSLKHSFLLSFKSSQRHVLEDSTFTNEDVIYSVDSTTTADTSDDAALLKSKQAHRRNTILISIFKRLSSYLVTFAFFAVCIVVLLVVWAIVLGVHSNYYSLTMIYFAGRYGCALDYSAVIPPFIAIVFFYVSNFFMFCLMFKVRDAYYLWLTCVIDVLCGIAWAIVIVIFYGVSIPNITASMY